MKAKEIILNQLLDKYERSKAYVQNTNRRILIKLENVKEYDIEDYSIKTIWNDTVKELKTKKLIDFNWVKFNEGNILEEVWLIKESADMAYEEINRINPKKSYTIVLKQLEKVDFTQKWLRDFSNDLQKYMKENQKENKLLPMDKSSKIIKALKEIDMSLEKKNINQTLKRLFSISCFSDSKYFERNIEKEVVRILRKYYLEEAAKLSKLSDDEVLAEVGIIKYPEVIEFCGELRCTISNKKVSFCNETLGSYINGNAILKMEDIELPGIERIIWIENKTNYIDYIVNKPENELVIYHGGFYSPIKGKFFEKIYLASKNKENKIKYYHWSDIDIGGFMIFTRLKNTIKELQPMRMNAETLLENKENWNYFDEKYREQLEKIRKDNKYYIFFNVIDEMLKYNVKLEQEAIIKNRYKFY